MRRPEPDPELEQAGRKLLALDGQPGDTDGPVVRWLARVAARLSIWVGSGGRRTR